MPQHKRSEDPLGVKRPNNVKSFNIPFAADDFSDLYMMASLVLGTMSLMIKYRILSWASLLAAIFSLGTMRIADMTFKNLFTTFSICVMATIFSYIGPNAANYV